MAQLSRMGAGVGSAHGATAREPGKARRVLFVIPSLTQGGAERQIVELAKRLDAAGFESQLCTLRDDDHYRSLLPPGQPRYRVGHQGGLTLAGVRRLAGIIRAARPDVVHSFMDEANLWARLAAPLAGWPTVITSVRGPWLRWRHLAVEGLLSRTVGRVVVVNSRSTVKELREWARVPGDRICIIHNLVDYDAFRPGTEEERQSARARFGLVPEEVALLLPGRMAPQKHQAGLAVALGRLRRRGALPSEARVLFAGRERDPWYGRLVDPMLRAAGVDHLVRRLGVVRSEEMRQLYLACDVLILPSLWEGLPNVALEAQACGRPAVVTDKANTDGIVVDGVTGYEAPLELGMGAYADALGRMLALPHVERQAMGRRGAEHVRREFDPARVLREYLELYATLLGED